MPDEKKPEVTTPEQIYAYGYDPTGKDEFMATYLHAQVEMPMTKDRQKVGVYKLVEVIEVQAEVKILSQEILTEKE